MNFNTKKKNVFFVDLKIHVLSFSLDESTILNRPTLNTIFLVCDEETILLFYVTLYIKLSIFCYFM